jgi:hypothetical protein
VVGACGDPFAAGGGLVRRIAPILIAPVVAALLPAPAGGPPPHDRPAAFTVITPAEIRWQDIPGGLGAQKAVIAGDPDKPGPYIVRVRFPPHVMDLPHVHPHVRYVTVLKGPWYAGTGPVFDPARAVPLEAGSVMVHPARAPHWDGSAGDQEAIVQIVGDGPGTSSPVDSHAPGWVHVAR